MPSPHSNPIPILSPQEVSASYLSTASPFLAQINNQFNIFSFQTIRPFILWPNIPFRNTNHGFVLVKKGIVRIQINQEIYSFGANCHFRFKRKCNQKLDGPAILGMILIVAGVVIMNLFSNSQHDV